MPGPTGRDEPVTHVAQPHKRGELRIYLGAAPGVGKTYAMLGEAHRRLERGTDVVAAVVETHGRKKIAELLEGIEIIPPRYICYRGTRFPELDVEAVLRRRPEVVLVDEYAHTNVPGSKNAKRWQDVEELLDAGITVISTVNIQHLESLNDVVAQITGIEQRETVPDEVVRKASQIELVDITPEALRRRLAHGNVYPPERIDAALSNYFRPGNLTALRELALLWLADQVDAALAKYRAEKKITDTWEARERVVVAVTGGPESETLVRRASRIASKSSAQLMVVHVVRSDGLSGVSAPQMGKVRELAASLGATVHTVVGDDVPTALLDFAREANATQLVLGTSRRSRWARLFSEGIGEATIERSGKIDVHLVTHEQASHGLSLPPISPRARHIASWLAAILVPSAILGITMAWFDRVLDVGGKTALFFLGVIAVALFGGMAPAILAGLLSGALLDYFLTEPRYSFAIASPSHLVMEVVLLGVAIAIAALVDSAARRARDAGRAAQEAELLALFAGSVLRGADLNTLLERVRETYSQRAVSLVRKVDGQPQIIACVGKDPCVTVDSADTAVEVGDEEFWMLLSGRTLTGRDRRVLSAVATQAAGLVKQRELAEEVSKAQSLAQADELRRLLLSALGHDLRTPLAAAKAAVSSLRAEDVSFSPEDTAELLATIEESIDQLTALVANLLDSSRLAAGVVRPKLSPVYLEEVVQRALVGLGKRSAVFGRESLDRVKVEVGGTVAMADAGLLERVLANLIDNALRYAPGSLVWVKAGQAGKRVLINVVDEGPGVAKGAAERMFEPFQRLGDRDNTTGLGLGLSVAKGFVEAMDGTIRAADTPGGGLTVEVDLAAPPPEPVATTPPAGDDAGAAMRRSGAK
ncbi:MAG: sensor histidine kinase KdpD [Mycobacterium sp.]|uniref:sensor histidine kinase n=1 Tax=Mycobacterium sp. TaxID=1785 RepID=UPI0026213ED4|nr:sensor histidine kinase KdpD [Mycobacterium sp.]MDI3314976.1 sensor histidine kinase KdpD [Mycobacterium sp.]